jgi:hypothetical protein
MQHPRYKSSSNERTQSIEPIDGKIPIEGPSIETECRRNHQLGQECVEEQRISSNL